MGKGAYLKQLTAATLQMKSVTVGKDLEGRPHLHLCS